MISGIPRKKSVYAAASARTGNHTGPRRVRSAATPQPDDHDQHGATTSSTRRLSHSPRRIVGQRVLGRRPRSRNDSRTRGQPGDSTIAVTTTARKTTVLDAGDADDRRARRRR